ncbi:MAG TPA: DEAD/DEAH box helicase [Tepidisphaeraceae bacterium]|nr:DEAD/DEAH box helicase [Tepidisphaeraceae bacterium]
MPISLSISPLGRLFVEDSPADPAPMPEATAKRITPAFSQSPARGLLHLATAELQTPLPPAFVFVRDFARDYLTRLCQTPGLDAAGGIDPIAPPAADVLGIMALQAPPMRGLEYLNAQALAGWWTELDALVREEAGRFAGGVQGYLREKNPLWRLVGRVTFHLAENKRDAEHPFAFMATYASRLSAQARVQHLPLGRALKEYSAAKDRGTLLALLTPIKAAAERSALAKELADSGTIYHALAWTPAQAYRFLREIPIFEESGLIVRVPDWWKATRPPRPVVSVKVGEASKSKLGVDAILDFNVGVTFNGEQLTQAELDEILNAAGGLVRLKGQWVEIDREKLSQALDHWKQIERDARHGEISFFEGMRLLSGAPLEGDPAAAIPESTREWTGIEAGEALAKTLNALRDPALLGASTPRDLKAVLRPYQQVGVSWLRFMTGLGLGACLADDMGLGKTIQVISLLLHLKRERAEAGAARSPSLLVVPASLIANWKSEISRFAPSLSIFIAHPSEMPADSDPAVRSSVDSHDLVITTYGMLARIAGLREKHWGLIIIDEAQAIKNSGSRQTRAVKELKGAGRIALTGTPIENRLSDLWSLFDFLNPGLLGGAKAFAKFDKDLATREHNPYAPLRALVRPYILRRLKTDKTIIADLPDKTEVTAFCGLSKRQTALYAQSVSDLARELKEIDGIKRRGVVLAYLMRLKQICNHPSQLTGDGAYEPEHSGKFHRLAELCEELAERQEKALIFTQFREITGALAEYLQGIFGRPGLVLHGQTPVGKRRELVESFQRDDGPPFFVLSLKAGGTGLNLTAASHVIHFDRWWNPAVENQATDRAFRIGQKRNVFVHKFVCRGTVEDRIDELIASKSGLAKDLLDGGGEVLLTEMSNDQLLKFVALDINKAQEA